MLTSSLNFRIWLIAIATVLPLFVAIAGVSTWQMKTYLEQQISVHNNDYAQALATAIGSNDASLTSAQQIINAQFDAGRYRFIRLENPDGEMLYQRVRSGQTTPTGLSFSMLALSITPGNAVVLQGWSPLNRIIVEADTAIAQSILARTIERLFLLCAAATVLIGLGGMALLKLQHRGLRHVIQHAEAIANRQFEPRPISPIAEYQPLSEALNTLAQKVDTILKQDARKLEKWSRESQTDKVTGLMNREPFLETLEDQVARHTGDQNSVLALIRVMDLATLNRTQGRIVIDNLIRELGLALRRLTLRMGGWSAGRLNGSDFAVLCPETDDVEYTAKQIHETMTNVAAQQGLDKIVSMPGSACIVNSEVSLASLLTSLDTRLAENESQGLARISVTSTDNTVALSASQILQDWNLKLQQALKEELFFLGDYPLVDAEGEFVHIEAPVRIAINKKDYMATEFLPWVSALGLHAQLDKAVIKLALDKIEATQRDVAVNLSFSALNDPKFSKWLIEKLHQHPGLTPKLWIEFTETNVFRHLSSLKKLSKTLADTHVRLGLEHAGHHIAEMGKLNNVGLHYVKIDGEFIENIQDNPANQKMIANMIEVLTSINLKVFAQGVETVDEWKTLVRAGVMGFTGPAVTNIIAPTPSASDTEIDNKGSGQAVWAPLDFNP